MAKSLEKLVESLQAEVYNLRAQVSPDRCTAPKDVPLPLYPNGLRQRKQCDRIL
jgi:hypothetical protein